MGDAAQLHPTLHVTIGLLGGVLPGPTSTPAVGSFLRAMVEADDLAAPQAAGEAEQQDSTVAHAAQIIDQTALSAFAPSCPAAQG